MPAKNVLKLYIENGYYHIYNRGVEKRIIFVDAQDYKVFLNYLKVYLQPQEQSTKVVSIDNTSFKAIERPLKNFHQEVELLAYCLMPNHFHLLIKQKGHRSIEFFMRALGTKYSGYFNKKHQRVGPLFQGPYKAALIENDEYLLHLSRYIHLNPYKDSPLPLANIHSSYPDYLEKRQTPWLNTQPVLSFFQTAKKTKLKAISSYQNFVEDYHRDSKQLLGELALD